MGIVQKSNDLITSLKGLDPCRLLLQAMWDGSAPFASGKELEEMLKQAGNKGNPPETFKTQWIAWRELFKAHHGFHMVSPSKPTGFLSICPLNLKQFEHRTVEQSLVFGPSSTRPRRCRHITTIKTSSSGRCPVEHRWFFTWFVGVVEWFFSSLRGPYQSDSQGP